MITIRALGREDAAQYRELLCGFEEWGREPAAVMIEGRPVAKLHMTRWL